MPESTASGMPHMPRMAAAHQSETAIMANSVSSYIVAGNWARDFLILVDGRILAGKVEMNIVLGGNGNTISGGRPEAPVAQGGDHLLIDSVP